MKHSNSYTAGENDLSNFMVKIEEDTKLDFSDVLFKPRPSTLKSRAQVNLERSFVFRNGAELSGVPIISANMDTTGTFEIALVLSQYKCFVAMKKQYNFEDWSNFGKEHPEALPYVAVSAGVSEVEFELVKQVTSAFPQIKLICLDVANGYSVAFCEVVRKFRAAFPDHVIIAGNVCTGEMTQLLIEAGADIIKIGIGPGSVCTTRIQTGVGAP